MDRFSRLYQKLDRSTSTRDKRQAIAEYFSTAPLPDAAWALYLLSGGKINSVRRKIASTAELRIWASQTSGLPDWLVEESYHHVGDLAETLALVMPDAGKEGATEYSLAEWIEERLLNAANGPTEERRQVVTQAWAELPMEQRLVFNKLLTGSLRVGVSKRLVQQALADMSGLDIAVIAQRMLGDWLPSPAFLRDLLSTDTLPGDAQQPYPFFLASPIEGEPAGLGPIEDWLLEWKWDGIRLQLIRRSGQMALWSRGEERLDGRFPELEAAAQHLPSDCVLDGELLAWQPGENQPLPFTALQTRIQRRKPSSRIMQEVPARLLVYDLLELDGRDLRGLPLSDRRAKLEALLLGLPADSPLNISPLVAAADWDAAARLRLHVRERGVEGLMLKRASSPYRAGRPRGDWWKWKIDPLSIDAVLIYAQPGHGRRSTLYTDYTFGLWDDGELTPVAKAYSGLKDEEILALDKWIRANTTERFGPVRAVRPHHVFELAFEAVNFSKRHKSGVAVRFPRILRWRLDKPMSEADNLDTLKSLAR